jgi:hypothetical protein
MASFGNNGIFLFLPGLAVEKHGGLWGEEAHHGGIVTAGELDFILIFSN